MDVRQRRVAALLVCCSALWAVVTSSSKASGCRSTLMFSSDVSSWTGGNRNTLSQLPWKWRTSTVPDRIPSTIWEAECTSDFCSSLWPGQRDAHRLNSVPIRQSLLVLTRNNGSRCYTASYRSVAVGCTCVRAITN